MQLDPLPMALDWQVEPHDWSVGPDGSLRIAAGPRTDLFADPAGQPAIANAPRLLGPVEGDFLLSVRVTPQLRATFDAGALVLYAAHDAWIKLALERSPEGAATIVSVVTLGLSDDCNSWTVDGDGVWLRIGRVGPACVLHASSDGVQWDLVRHLAFDVRGDLAVGFLAQSPTGDGAAARFADVRFAAATLVDVRDGS